MKMMEEDLGVEAKEEAVREVAKLLPFPKANDAQLSTVVAEQKTIHQQRENFISIEKLCQECENLFENHDQIKLLSNAMNNLNTTLKANDAQLNTMVVEQITLLIRLCQECQNLIENHNQIKLLSNARSNLNTTLKVSFMFVLIENHDQIKLPSNASNNLNTTLKDVEGMMSISVKATKARDSLSDDKELVNTYERLTALDGIRRLALAAVASHKEEVSRLSSFNRIFGKSKQEENALSQVKMMVEDLGIDAKEAVVREVAKLLPFLKLLQSISTIKADYITRQQVTQLLFLSFLF
ncbi:hypothetical protein DITRI_Ditri07aG0043200 [Diplodiscus trichospermus]